MGIEFCVHGYRYVYNSDAFSLPTLLSLPVFLEDDFIVSSDFPHHCRNSAVSFTTLPLRVILVTLPPTPMGYFLFYILLSFSLVFSSFTIIYLYDFSLSPSFLPSLSPSLFLFLSFCVVYVFPSLFCWIDFF